MSGTSCDGLDLAHCCFTRQADRWYYQILDARTIPYDRKIKAMLNGAGNTSAENLNSIDTILGQFFSSAVLKYLLEKNTQVDFIASHGHTIFHDPLHHLNLQVGKGATIASVTGITTVCDFRTQDITLGGQGAPLVPVGDLYLFSDYDLCLNIGGISNISSSLEGRTRAWDICPANIVLNLLAEREGLDFDADGNLSSQGSIIPELLDRLNALPYYAATPPKSLGREWIDAECIPLILSHKGAETCDLLRTVTEHIAVQIGHTCNALAEKGTMLVTGGGAKNRFLMERINALTGVEIPAPPPFLIDFKEALIFAFLGVLRIRGEHNCLSSVTGAGRDQCCGAIYKGYLNEKDI